MDWNVVNGVRLHQIQSNKFLRSKITFRFQKKYSNHIATKWTIISECINILFEKEYESLYGLWNTKITAYTATHRDKLWLSINIDTVNNERVILQTINILLDVLFKSNILLNRKLFIEGKKKNLFNLESINMNDDLKASFEFLDLHFGKMSDFNGSSIGDKNSTDVMSYADYLSALTSLKKKVSLNILIIGDVSSCILKSKLESVLYSPIRESDEMNLEMYTETKSTFRSGFRESNLSLSKLMVSYNTNVLFSDNDYPSLLVYDALLGAFNFSFLGSRIRKEGVAYYVVSTLDPFRGFQIITTGITIEQKSKFDNILDHEIKRIQNGDFDFSILSRAKKALINQLLLLMDDSSKLIENHFIDNVYLNKSHGRKLINEIVEINKNDVIRVALKSKKKSEFFLRTK